MAEQLATLRQKGGGGVPSNLFSISLLAEGKTSWYTPAYAGTVNDPDSTGVAVALDPTCGHVSNSTVVIDKAIPNAYISGRAFTNRNTAGTAIYGSVRVQKNGTTISGTSVTATSSSTTPSFRRVRTSFAVGDVITVQVKASASSGTGPAGFVNIVTDD